MIKNERQYRITRSQEEKFERALQRLKQDQRGDTSIRTLLRRAQNDAMRCQLADLKNQLAEYESLQSGNRRVFVAESFDELPRFLIQARIANGLSQKDLAHRLGIKEQQVQRYEASAYASASLSRVQEVIRALGITVREEVSLAVREQ